LLHFREHFVKIMCISKIQSQPQKPKAQKVRMAVFEAWIRGAAMQINHSGAMADPMLKRRGVADFENFTVACRHGLGKRLSGIDGIDATVLQE